MKNENSIGNKLKIEGNLSSIIIAINHSLPPTAELSVA